MVTHYTSNVAIESKFFLFSFLPPSHRYVHDRRILLCSFRHEVVWLGWSLLTNSEQVVPLINQIHENAGNALRSLIQIRKSSRHLCWTNSTKPQWQLNHQKTSCGLQRQRHDSRSYRSIELVFGSEFNGHRCLVGIEWYLLGETKLLESIVLLWGDLV